MRLRKLLHSKPRPVRDVFFVNSDDGRQFRVVGCDQKQPEVGDVFACVPASRRRSRGSLKFRVLEVSPEGLYKLLYVVQ